ncbi:MAG: hypothetical protein ACYCVH_11940 [Ignavibacteriaceae bacterium]
MKKHFEVDKKYLDKIITVAYGDGNLFDKIEVYLKAYSNPSVKKLLNEYKLTSKAVESIYKEYLPNDILKTVQKKVNIEENKLDSFFSGAFKFLVFKPMYSVAAVIIILSISTFLLVRQPKPEKTYSKVEVELAEKQVKESFALVGKILAKTQNKVTNEIIGKEVVRPIQKGTAVINNLFNGG